MSEITIRPTGELVDLDGPTDTLAAALDDIRELEADLRSAKRAVQDEVLKRMDRAAKWTADLGGYELRAPSPSRTTYDTGLLRDALERLVRDGAIDQDAADDAVQPSVEYRVSRAAVNRLLKLGGDTAAAVAACQVPDDRPRYVTVRRHTQPPTRLQPTAPTEEDAA